MDEQERLRVEQAQSNPLAFADLYDAYVDRIYNYVYQRTGNHADAEDLTARTFLKAFASIERFRFRGAPFAAWLYRIAHNAIANWYRDRSKHPMLSLDAVAMAGPERERVEDVTQARERERTLLDAIHLLSPERQQLLILKFSDGLSNAEIGRIMGKTEGAIKSLYHRTLLDLRETLIKNEMD